MENQEIVNSLLAYKDMKIIQRKDMFNFSIDTVLIANFCSLRKETKYIIDFGTNNAAIPLLLSNRTNSIIEGIEIQEEAVDIAKRNIALNNLDEQISIIHGDIKSYNFEKKYQLVVCNPPFFPYTANSNINQNEYLTIARHEIMIDLEDIIKNAARILDNKGRLSMVHRPDRLIDIVNYMQKYNIEPKRIQMVYPKKGREANVILIEGIFQGNKGIKIEGPLYAHNDDGSYSKEIQKMFGEKFDE